MDERRSQEGVEHLQAAARELLGAARAFLDVVEDVVEDPDRLTGAAATVSDLVRNGVGLIRGGDEPWSGPTRSTDWWDEPVADDPASDEPAADQPAAETPPVVDDEGTSSAPPRRTGSRVRRIAVD